MIACIECRVAKLQTLLCKVDMRLFFKKLISRCQTVLRLDKTQDDVLLERLSHEVRTLLTGIVGYAEFLETDSSVPMVGFTAKIIRESGQALTRVNAAYYDLRALKSGRLNIYLSNFDLLSLVYKVIDTSRAVALDRQVHLVFHADSELSSVLINSDKKRILQVLNLIVNYILQSALKHSIGKVGLSVENKKYALHFEYENASDSERNLESDFWNHSFYQYQRQAGPGIELALAKGLIEWLGWEVAYQVSEEGVSKLSVMMNVYRYEK